MALDQQTEALLSYNAANPDMVRRIVQERGLTQEEVSQALNVSPAVAARYGGAAVGGGMPQDSGAMPPRPGAAALSNPAGMQENIPASGGNLGMSSISSPAPAGMATGGMNPDGAAGEVDAGPANLGISAMRRPAGLPAGLRPQGMGGPGGQTDIASGMRPAAPSPGTAEAPAIRLPRGAGAAVSTTAAPLSLRPAAGRRSGEQAFRAGFNSVRGSLA